MCQQRNWNTSRLLLALPQADRAKSNVALHTYTSVNYRTQALVEWVYSLTKQKVRQLNSTTDVSHWLSRSCAADVCLLLVSTLTLPPFFLSALSVKFTGRVKFGSCSQRALRNSAAAQQLSITSNSSANQAQSDADGEYVVVADNRTVHYGSGPRERLAFSALQTYLKWLAPDINDVFLFSLAGVNVLALMNLFNLRGSPFQCMFQLIITLLKYNFCLLLIWIVILSVINWKMTLSVCKLFTTTVRRLAMTTLFRRLIAEWSWASNRTGLLGSTFFLFNSLLYCLRRRFFPSTLNQPESWSEWLRSTNWANIPIVPDLPRFGSTFYDTADVSSLDSLDPVLLTLIRRWGIQQVYVHPSIPYNYILNLPFWCCNLNEDFDPEIGRRCNKRLCLRCQCVKSLKLKKLSMKLHRRPCKKCGFSGVVSATVNSRQQIISPVDSVACPICLDMFNNGDVLCGLPCDHVYHQKCILSWLLRDQPSCPCCRWPAYETKEKTS